MYLRKTANIIYVIAESYEQIEEQLTPAGEHFHLHSATSLKCGS